MRPAGSLPLGKVGDLPSIDDWPDTSLGDFRNGLLPNYQRAALTGTMQC
jgi:hypothetical protein